MKLLVKALFVSCFLAASAQAADRPNVVLVVMDNLGWKLDLSMLPMAH